MCSKRTLPQRDHLQAYLPNYLKGHESAIVARVTYGQRDARFPRHSE